MQSAGPRPWSLGASWTSRPGRSPTTSRSSPRAAATASSSCGSECVPSPTVVPGWRWLLVQHGPAQRQLPGQSRASGNPYELEAAPVPAGLSLSPAGRRKTGSGRRSRSWRRTVTGFGTWPGPRPSVCPPAPSPAAPRSAHGNPPGKGQRVRAGRAQRGFRGRAGVRPRAPTHYAWASPEGCGKLEK